MEFLYERNIGSLNCPWKFHYSMVLCLSADSEHHCRHELSLPSPSIFSPTVLPRTVVNITFALIIYPTQFTSLFRNAFKIGMCSLPLLEFLYHYSVSPFYFLKFSSHSPFNPSISPHLRFKSLNPLPVLSARNSCFSSIYQCVPLHQSSFPDLVPL